MGGNWAGLFSHISYSRRVSGTRRFLKANEKTSPLKPEFLSSNEDYVCSVSEPVDLGSGFNKGFHFRVFSLLDLVLSPTLSTGLFSSFPLLSPSPHLPIFSFCDFLCFLMLFL